MRKLFEGWCELQDRQVQREFNSLPEARTWSEADGYVVPDEPLVLDVDGEPFSVVAARKEEKDWEGAVVRAYWMLTCKVEQPVWDRIRRQRDRDLYSQRRREVYKGFWVEPIQGGGWRVRVGLDERVCETQQEAVSFGKSRSEYAQIRQQINSMVREHCLIGEENFQHVWADLFRRYAKETGRPCEKLDDVRDICDFAEFAGHSLGLD